MKKAFLFKLFLSFIFLTLPVFAKDTYVSLAPSVTEMIYMLNAQDNLIAVSSRCNYPVAAVKKEKLGSLYSFSKEKIIKLAPDYIFALSTSEPFLFDLKNSSKLVYFDFNSVDDIYAGILKLGKILNVQKRAESLVLQMKKDIVATGKNKSVLYVVQSQPLIVIGSKSYLTDVIKLSGNYSATKDVSGYYPSISKEYALKLCPDYVVVGPYADINELKPFFKNSKFVTMTKYQNDVINRPGPRIAQAVKFFGELK